jgi:hypothetical protein
MSPAGGLVRPMSMMLVHRACSVVIACACVAAALPGRGSGGDDIPSPPSAVDDIPARAYALDVTTAGRVAWQVWLGSPPPASGVQVSPLTVGAVAIFAQGNVLYGLRLADGHRLWSRAVGPGIAGMWRWQNLVVVLTGSMLTGLDASTGQVRWRLPAGSMEAPSPTADGGLAVIVWSEVRGDGALEVVDLSGGRVRWARTVSSFDVPPVALGGGAVLLASNNQLTSYDDRTGRVRWTETVVSPFPAVATPAGIVTAPGPDQITMSDTLTGQTRWTASLTGGWVPLVIAPWVFNQALPVFPSGPLLVVPAAGPDGSDLLSAFSMSDGHPAWQITIPGPVEAPLSAVPGGTLVYTVIPQAITAP